jgi:hypothetical protein
MNRCQYALERSHTARALSAVPLAVALVARIATIGRIAHPFVDVDFAAALAAGLAVAQERQNAAFTASISTRLAAARPAFIAAAIPNNRRRQARQAQAAHAGSRAEGSAARSAGWNATAAAADEGRRSNQGEQPSHHGEDPWGETIIQVDSPSLSASKLSAIEKFAPIGKFCRAPSPRALEDRVHCCHLQSPTAV